MDKDIINCLEGHKMIVSRLLLDLIEVDRKLINKILKTINYYPSVNDNAKIFLKEIDGLDPLIRGNDLGKYREAITRSFQS